MISLTIGTNTERKTAIVQPTDKLSDVLKAEGVNANGCALHLNGSLIAGADTQLTFTELGIQDGSKASLIAVVKADSAK